MRLPKWCGIGNKNTSICMPYWPDFYFRGNKVRGEKKEVTWKHLLETWILLLLVWSFSSCELLLYTSCNGYVNFSVETWNVFFLKQKPEQLEFTCKKSYFEVVDSVLLVSYSNVETNFCYTEWKDSLQISTLKKSHGLYYTATFNSFLRGCCQSHDVLSG